MEKMAVTGGAGFIGSNLAERLAAWGYPVLIVDNFSTGRERNLAGWNRRFSDRLEVVREDVNETGALRRLFQGVRFVFHQAAIPSVPRSVADPALTHSSNITGTLSVLIAARDAGVSRVVVASSSSVYGDDATLPKQEARTGNPLSPYALSKLVCEQYCRLFHRLYGLESVCLRYFNVFGPRQDPQSEYAAVIPRFSTRLLAGARPTIYGDGEQTRDFTYIDNVVDANWQAANHPRAAGEVFNIGCGTQTSLNQLVRELNAILGTELSPVYEASRPGDVRHSVADVGKARDLLEYTPAVSLRSGLEQVLEWFRDNAEV
jgi:nucleoside-diphosphate-sugar epimerase